MTCRRSQSWAWAGTTSQISGVKAWAQETESVQAVRGVAELGHTHL